MKRVFPLLALLVGLWLPPDQVAAQDQGMTCTALIDDINFGNVTMAGSDIAATVYWQCSRVNAGQSANMRMCLFISPGLTTTDINPRWMRQGDLPFTALISYDIFADSSRTQKVNPEGYGLPLSFTMEFRAGEYFATDPIPVYVRLYPQVGDVPLYQYSDNSLQITPVRTSYNLSGPAPSVDECLSGGGEHVATPGMIDTFNVHAQIENTCAVGIATDLDFGEVSSLTDGHEQTSTINLHCPSSTMAWHLKLNDGEHGTGGQRRMANADGTLFVEYELYRDSSRTQRWGDTDDTDVDGTGTGSVQTVTVYGRTSLQSPTPPPGVYSDTITVTLTF